MSEPIRTDVCRQCGGTAHYAREVNAVEGSINLLPIGFFTVGKLMLRVCGTCGLIEWYVPERFLAGVREKFPKVG